MNDQERKQIMIEELQKIYHRHVLTARETGYFVDPEFEDARNIASVLLTNMEPGDFDAWAQQYDNDPWGFCERDYSQ